MKTETSSTGSFENGKQCDTAGFFLEERGEAELYKAWELVSRSSKKKTEPEKNLSDRHFLLYWQEKSVLSTLR